MQSCRRSSKWRVISRSTLGECSLTFLVSIYSGLSLAEIPQLQIPLQRDTATADPVLGKINANICLQPLGHCRNTQLPVKQAVRGYFRHFYIIFYCMIQTSSGLFFFKHMSLEYCLMNGNGRSLAILLHLTPIAGNYWWLS